MYLTCEITQHQELEAKEKKRLIYKAPLPRKALEVVLITLGVHARLNNLLERR